MRALLLVIFSFIVNTVIHAQLSAVQLNNYDKDSMAFIGYLPQGCDFLLAYSEESYWWSNTENFKLLVLKDNRWSAWTYHRKWKSSSDVYANKGIKQHKYFKKSRLLPNKWVGQLFDSLSAQGLWSLPHDSLNQTRIKIIPFSNGDSMSVVASISDAINYKFRIESKKGFKVIESYAPEYFIGEFPDMKERIQFIQAKNTFVRWWKRYCR